MQSCAPHYHLLSLFQPNQKMFACMHRQGNPPLSIILFSPRHALLHILPHVASNCLSPYPPLESSRISSCGESPVVGYWTKSFAFFFFRLICTQHTHHQTRHKTRRHYHSFVHFDLLTVSVWRIHGSPDRLHHTGECHLYSSMLGRTSDGMRCPVHAMR